MSGIILQILSVIGILLLILLGLILLLLALLLFWPVTYRISGEKNPEKLMVSGRADWLFGILRVRYRYPEPNTVTVRLLWKTLMDTGQKKQESDGEEDSPSESKEQPERRQETQAEQKAKTESKAAGEQEAQTGSEAAGERETQTGPEAAKGQEAQTRSEAAGGQEAQNSAEGQASGDGADAEGDKGSLILQKFQKLKYTILKIYDKIKEIWANISYYNDLLHEESTLLLWKHVKLRLGKVLRNIRPRHIKARVIFGTGAPDTTGYAYGVYGMLSPVLGRDVCLTPDFERAVLEGTFEVSGHITLCTILWNALKLLLDQKLRLFIKKMKAGRKENGR